jgi:hypothetical protein
LINLIVVLLSLITPVDSNLRPAVRVGNMYQETPLPPPPVELTGCDEMTFYRQEVGLPEVFDRLGWRESNCRNDVRTFCCYGYLQIYISLWLSPKSTYREGLINTCGITGVSSIFGLSDEQKQAQMCAVKIVYDIDGLRPWRL